MRSRSLIKFFIVFLAIPFLFLNPISADSPDEDNQQTVYEEQNNGPIASIINSFRQLVKEIKIALNGIDPDDLKVQIVQEALNHLDEDYSDSVSFLYDIYTGFGIELNVDETRGGGKSWSECDQLSDYTYGIYHTIEPGDILAWYIVADNITGSPDMCAIYLGNLKGNYLQNETEDNIMISCRFGIIGSENLVLDESGYIRKADDFDLINCITVIDGTVSLFNYKKYIDTNGYNWPSYTHFYSIK